MFTNSNLMKTNYLLEKALSVESLRRKVISNNIANVDTPHFKRREVNFESALKMAVFEKNRHSNKLPVLTSDKKHIPFFQEKDLRSVRHRINLDYTTTQRNDGNNVDVEKEIVDAAKNLMRYNAFVTSMNQNFKIIKMAMKPA